MSNLKEDFYDHVNENWLKETEIPNDKPAINGFSILSDEIESLLIDDVKKMATDEIPTNSEELKSFVAFYKLAADEKERHKMGLKPLIKRLGKIESLQSLSDLTNQLADWIKSGYPLPFSVFVSPDMKKADHYGVYLAPPSLILPDTTYYAENHPSGVKLLAVYSEMMIELLVLLGKTNKEATKIVENACFFDKSLVPFIKSAEESADYTKNYNPKSMEEVSLYHSDIPFKELLTYLLGTTPDKIIVTEPNYFEHLSHLVSEGQLSLLKDWMLCKYILRFTNLLDENFRMIANRYNLTLSGAKEPVSHEKMSYYLASGQFDQVVGQYYAATYFSEQAKKDVEQMVKTMIQIYQKRLKENDWLDDKTKEKAILKLNKLAVQVGYPNELKALYSQYKTVSKEDGGTLIDNIEQFNRLTTEYLFSRYNKKVNKEEWGMSADTVNAYYNPQQNVIVFPAAILQAPFYDYNQSASANYGGIGAVIAHEISHAFDNNGAKFDELGNLNNWWTEEDLAHFDTLTKQMIDEFDGIPFGDGKVNGTLTVSENIADAGGLSCALEAAQTEDNYNGKDLFENWARIWRNKSQNEYINLLLAVDVHGPAKLRANVQLQNLEEFYRLYDIKPGDAMYREPDKRVSIW